MGSHWQSVRLPSLPNDPSTGVTSDGCCNGPKISQGRCGKCVDLLAHDTDRNGTTISMLTDNVLLEIFYFYPQGHDEYPAGNFYRVWKWHLLVQVCRRWRQIIFASPRRLALRLFCKDGTPVRKNLGIWPTIPIVMQYGHYGHYGRSISLKDEDNVIAGLEHPNRICYVHLDIKGSQLEMIANFMLEPFPVLTHLSISSDSEDGTFPVLPGGLLGGSASSLRTFKLTSITFPALPTLLLSASDLVELALCDVPPTSYISPEAMVAHLAMLPKLETLRIEFEPVASHLDQMLLPPKTRTVLPALHFLFFDGVCGYLEDFLARIDTPQLNSILMTCTDQLFYSDQVVEVPQLFKFIDRSKNLKDTLSGHCEIMLDDSQDTLDFCIGGAPSDEAEIWDPDTGITIWIIGKGVEQQFLHLTHVFSCISPILSGMVHFTIDSNTCIAYRVHPLPPFNIDWLRLLRPFSSVRTLLVSFNMAEGVTRSLGDITEVTVTEVLPALELLCLEDYPLSSVDRFLAVRRDSGYPVTIVKTKECFEERLKSYP